MILVFVIILCGLIGILGVVEALACYALPHQQFMKYVERSKKRFEFDYETEFEVFKKFRFHLLAASFFLLLTAAALLKYVGAI